MDDAEPEAVDPVGRPPDVMSPSLSFDLGAQRVAAEPEGFRPWTPQGRWYTELDLKQSDTVSRARRNTAAVLLAVLLAGVVGAAIGLAVGSRGPTASGPGVFNFPPGSSSLPGGPSSLNAISKAFTPTVVDIDTSVDEGSGVGEAAGSGMILTSGGEVLTNNHVIEDATRISVLIHGRSRPVAARVVGVDIVHDVALLQLTGVSSLPHVVLGDSSNLKVGDGVVAIGNALGIDGPPAVTGGAVSALNQSITATSDVSPSSENLKGLIETDAQIQPGDSGGPLVDAAGRVVGMDTAAASDDGGTSIGFAIPINEAIGIAHDIEKGIVKHGIIVGLSAFLGVGVRGVLSGQGAPATGAFVEDVTPGGPAATAGVVAGDTITAMNGRALTDETSSLTSLLLTLKPGASARLRVVSLKGATSVVPVVLGSIPL